MKKQRHKLLFVLLISAILSWGSAVLAHESSVDSDASPSLVLAEALVPLNVGITLLNGFLWMGDREQDWTGGIGIAVGAATLLLSSWTLFSQKDRDEATSAFIGVGIGGLTTTLGVINLRHAQQDRQEHESHATSVAPSVFKDVTGNMTTGVMLQIDF